MHILTKLLDQGVPVDVVYMAMDQQNAFDTVPHKRLLYKIKYYGIIGNLLRCIAGFLSNRRQCVVLNGSKPIWQDVKSGVPQGSILGPLLFLIYVNDLPRLISNQVFLFAEDTKLIRYIGRSCTASNSLNGVTHGNSISMQLNVKYSILVKPCIVMEAIN